MTIAAVKRMILKFEATECLNRPCNGLSSISGNAPETVQEEMEIVASSSRHGEVGAHEVTQAFYTVLFG